MAKQKIILIGGGGHCKSSIDIIDSTGEYEILGIVDQFLNQGDQVLGYPVLGKDEDLTELAADADCGVVTIGQIKSVGLRKKLFDKLNEVGLSIPAIKAATANVSQHTKIGAGTLIFHNVMINADTEIGQNCIINTSAVVEHDVRIGSNSHISTSATLNGNVEIGADCFVGSNSVINQGIKVCDQAIIGAGSVVVSDITKPGVYIGNPAKINE